MLYTQLRSFHAVASEGGFTSASKILNVGQPTITSQVKGLEDYFQIELFHRRGRSVVLTEAGKGLFTITQPMMGQEREAIDYLNALSGFHTGHLRLGAVGPFYVTEILQAFSARYPDLEVTVQLGNSHEMLRRLLDLSVDVAMLAQIEEDPRFVAIPYIRHPIVAFMRRDHPLASKAAIAFEDLADERLVLREAGSTTRRMLDALWARLGMELKRQLVMGSREGVWVAVMRGLGVGFVNEGEFIPHEDLVMRPIKGHEIESTDHVVYLAERGDSRIIKAFRGVVEEILAGKGGGLVTS